MNPYSVYVTPSALREVKDLPGHVHQRVKRAIDDLASNLRPPGSKTLDLTGMEAQVVAECEVCRLRIENRRLVYTITEAEKNVDVSAGRMASKERCDGGLQLSA